MTRPESPTMSPSRRHERCGLPPGDRAIAPLVGVLVLLGLVVALASVVALLAAGVGPAGPIPPTATLSLTVDAGADELALDHRGGDTLDVTDLSLVVTVDDEPLSSQPPVPFFQADGFRGGPGGPFNAASDPEWSVGERASVRLAGTNAPRIDAGDAVAVRVLDDRSGAPVAEPTATAE